MAPTLIVAPRAPTARRTPAPAVAGPRQPADHAGQPPLPVRDRQPTISPGDSPYPLPLSDLRAGQHRSLTRPQKNGCLPDLCLMTRTGPCQHSEFSAARPWWARCDFLVPRRTSTGTPSALEVGTDWLSSRVAKSLDIEELAPPRPASGTGPSARSPVRARSTPAAPEHERLERCGSAGGGQVGPRRGHGHHRQGVQRHQHLGMGQVPVERPAPEPPGDRRDLVPPVGDPVDVDVVPFEGQPVWRRRRGRCQPRGSHPNGAHASAGRGGSGE